MVIKMKAAAIDFLKQARGSKSALPTSFVDINIPESGLGPKPFSFQSDSSLRQLTVRVICQIVSANGTL